jgi:hypothetical protein
VIVKNKQDDLVFESIIESNFKKQENKSASRIAVEVLIQLTAFWMLTNLAIYVWRICTGC